MKLLNEETLLQHIRKGERSAMAELYRRYAPLLYAVCRRYLPQDEDAKDVLQESFIKIFASIGRFDPQHNGAMKAWAKRVTVNCALNYLRDNHRVQFIEAEGNIEDIPDDEIHASQLPAGTAQRLIEELPAGYRTVFNLYAIEGMSHREIATLLGITEGTSASQYSRAKRLLKQKIKRHLK